MTKIAEINQDSSASFSEDSEETRVRKFAKHMLKSTLFIGSFQEKRFVEPLNSYRDVIKVADDETDFIENLIAVKKRCAKFFVKNVWIGITEPKTIGTPAGYNLWVSLDEEVFGSYWYKIKSVKFHSNEVCLKLEVVRPVSREKTPVHNITPQQVLEDVSQHDVSELGVKISHYFKEKFSELFREILTVTNIKEAIIFIFLLLSTLITFLVHAIQYLLEYFLKLLHETSGFIKVCSPIIISFIRLIMNTINGFYALIAVMWRDRSPPNINQNLYQLLPYESPYNNNMRALPYQGDVPRNRKFYRSSGSSVRITPLN
ncbi:hypothetical protein BDFB_003791 [Asbolus verrucosus]|uniref:Uncharacterized protein n=1 Tax=Asbolus verrucosus TaxID=1661398 RepID=A0A482W5X8_ASBVE|nr:hypothetical protein BDFB_003791 [Asbolus verrucosus]